MIIIHTRSVLHFNATLFAYIRQHKYLVIFKGKKLPNYFNICQTQAHLTIQEQMSASSICCKVDPLLDSDISCAFSCCYSERTMTTPYLSHSEHFLKNENKAPDTLVLKSTHKRVRAHPQSPDQALVHHTSLCKSSCCQSDVNLCLLRQRA